VVGAVGVADEIGSGEDVPRRRSRRLWTAVWAVAVLAVVGSLLVHLVRGSFADGAARRLAESWASYGGLDSQRYSLVEAVKERAGLGDDQLIEDARRTADRTEIRVLTDLRAHAAAGHAWVDDVAAARSAVLATFAEQIRSLEADIASASPTIGIVSSDRGAVLKERADELVAAVVSNHHLGDVRPHPVVMPPLADALEQTAQPADVDTGLHLVIDRRGATWDFDLDTGRRSKLHLNRGFVVTTLAGDTVVMTRIRGVTVLPAEGPSATLPTGRYPQVIGADPTGFWLSVTGQVRRIDATGRPDTPWIDLPAGNWFAEAASREGLLLSRYAGATAPGDDAPTTQALAIWWPGTGRMSPLANTCGYTNVTAAVEALLVFGCRNGPGLTAYDSESGKKLAAVESLPFRGSRSVSPDGRVLAVGRKSGRAAVALIDLRTGSIEKVRMPELVQPVAWSADGHWLLLERNAAIDVTGVNNLVLLEIQTTRLVPLRLRFNVISDTVIGLR
jgi:hypothetical protein